MASVYTGESEPNESNEPNELNDAPEISYGVFESVLFYYSSVGAINYGFHNEINAPVVDEIVCSTEDMICNKLILLDFVAYDEADYEATRMFLQQKNYFLAIAYLEWWKASFYFSNVDSGLNAGYFDYAKEQADAALEFSNALMQELKAKCEAEVMYADIYARTVENHRKLSELFLECQFRLHEREGAWEVAVNYFDDIVSKIEGDVVNFDNANCAPDFCRRLSYKSHYFYGDALYALGDYESARKCYESAKNILVELNGQDDKDRAFLASIVSYLVVGLLRLAETAIKNQKYDLAVGYFQNMIDHVNTPNLVSDKFDFMSIFNSFSDQCKSRAEEIEQGVCVEESNELVYVKVDEVLNADQGIMIDVRVDDSAPEMLDSMKIFATIRMMEVLVFKEILEYEFFMDYSVCREDLDEACKHHQLAIKYINNILNFLEKPECVGFPRKDGVVVYVKAMKVKHEDLLITNYLKIKGWSSSALVNTTQNFDALDPAKASLVHLKKTVSRGFMMTPAAEPQGAAGSQGAARPPVLDQGVFAVTAGLRVILTPIDVGDDDDVTIDCSHMIISTAAPGAG